MADMSLEEAIKILKNMHEYVSYDDEWGILFNANIIMAKEKILAELDKPKEMTARELFTSLSKNCELGGCGGCNYNKKYVCKEIKNLFPCEWDIDKILSTAERLKESES